MKPQEKKLYPFHFQPITEEEPWGRSVCLIADTGRLDNRVADGWLAGNTLSDLMDTYLDRMTGEEVYNFYGRQFPVLVRRLEINGNYGLYVCPNDIIAEQRYDALGKKKLWYVLEAKEDAAIYLGLSETVTASGLYEGCRTGGIVGKLRKVRAEAGGCYEIEPGCIHGAAGMLTILEVAESSELDLKIYDWGDDPAGCEEGIIAAIDFIDLEKYREDSEEDCGCGGSECEYSGCEGSDCKCSGGHHGPEGRGGRPMEVKMTERLAEGAEFTVTALRLSAPIHLYTEKFPSFLLYCCLRGEASVQVRSDKEKGGDLLRAERDFYELKAGQVLLVPAETADFLMVPLETDTLLLETILEHREIPDAYIHPEVPERIEGEEEEEEEAPVCGSPQNREGCYFS